MELRRLNGLSYALTLDELHRRLRDIAAGEDIEADRLDDLRLMSLAGEDALLAVTDGRSPLRPTGLFEALDRSVEKLQPRLIVLDTLADLFGGEENDRAHARQFISMLRGLSLKRDTTVLVLAHPSLSGMASGSGSSGSTGWNNSVRSRLYFERVKNSDGSEDDSDLRVLRNMKANYARKGGEFRVRWQDGYFVPQGVVEVREQKGLAERQFLHLLALYNEQVRRVSVSPGSNYAPAMFSKEENNGGVTKKGFENAMNRLLRSGQIRIAAEGPDSRRRRFIEEVPEKE